MLILSVGTAKKMINSFSQYFTRTIKEEFIIRFGSRNGKSFQIMSLGLNTLKKTNKISTLNHFMILITKKLETSPAKYELILFLMEELLLTRNQPSPIRPTNFFMQ